MSRNVARKTITVEQHLLALQRVECRTDAQRDLTEAVHTLKQIVVVKG
jgi:hypothetical protein